jgi:hypothetical protein
MRWEVTVYNRVGERCGVFNVDQSELGWVSAQVSQLGCCFTASALDRDHAPPASSARPARRPPERSPEQPDQPEQIDAHAKVMNNVYAQISLQHFQNLHDLREMTQGCVQIMLDQTRRFTEELAFARAATAKSLESVDLMNRTQTAMLIEKRFAPQEPQSHGAKPAKFGLFDLVSSI